jgi:hypothetical protein
MDSKVSYGAQKMKAIKKTFAVIFAILFVITAIAALIFFNFDRNAFSIETYQKAFVNADFYNKVPAIMAEVMASTTTNQEKLPIVMRGMSTPAWEAFFRSLLPQDVLKSMSDEALNSVFTYLNMQTNSAELSLTSIKTSMVSDIGVQAVLSLLKTQPECTLQQIGQITIDLFSNSQIQFCNPPEKLIPLLTPIIQGQMQMTALALPDQFTIISAILAVNSLKSWLKWWGFPFIITGGLASLMSLSGAPATGAIFQKILVTGMPAFLPTVMLDYAGNLASAMVQALLSPVLFQGLIIAVIGLVMVAGAYFVKANK